MSSSTDPIEALGDAVARARRAGVDELGVAAEAERRWAARSVARPHRRSWHVAAGVSFAAAAAALVVWAVTRPPPILVARVGDAPAQMGRWFDAREDAALRFSDATTVLIERGGRARIESVSARGARVRLQRGHLVASVTHAANTEWLFRVGPYDVHVTGTQFRASWSPELQRFDLEMTVGSVVVTGPGISGERVLIAGQRLSLEPPRARVESHVEQVRPSADVAPSRNPGDVAVQPPPIARGAAASNARREPSPALPAEPSDSWETFADDGRYDDALAAARTLGFERLCSDLEASELLRLGDVARYASDRVRARVAYEAVRSRFPGSEAGASAAYSLGLMAPADPESIRWFEQYLDESPTGPLARSARGRLLEAYRLSRDHAHARAAARDYLARYPDGPHAELANTLLE